MSISKLFIVNISRQVWIPWLATSLLLQVEKGHEHSNRVGLIEVLAHRHFNPGILNVNSGRDLDSLRFLPELETYACFIISLFCQLTFRMSLHCRCWRWARERLTVWVLAWARACRSWALLARNELRASHSDQNSVCVHSRFLRPGPIGSTWLLTLAVMRRQSRLGYSPCWLSGWQWIPWMRHVVIYDAIACSHVRRGWEFELCWTFLVNVLGLVKRELITFKFNCKNSIKNLN